MPSDPGANSASAADDLELLSEIVATHEALSTSAFDLEAVMTEIVTQSCRLTRAEGSVVELVDGRDLVYRAGSGTGEAHVGLRLSMDGSLSGHSVRTGEIAICDDAETDERANGEAALTVGARSMIVVPMRHHGDEISGVLKVFSAEPNAFGERELRVLQMLASTLGAAIQRAELLERLLDEAKTDPLTGLSNRRAWDEEAPLELDRAARAGAPVSLAIIDIDTFKAYNDEHGHDAGDRLLVHCASRWNFAVRSVDLVARLGGEEFGVLLPACGLDDAVEVVERMREATHDLRTISVGVAQWDGTEELADLIHRADQALLQAKDAGRDRIVRAA